MTEPEENKFITECEHCNGFGCSICEDITLRQTNEDVKKLREDLLKNDSKN